MSGTTGEVEKRFAEGPVRVGCIGLGYVGLPLAVEFASAGVDVVGFDLIESKVASVNRGESYVQDIATDRLAPLVKAGRVRATTDFDELRQCDAVIICVPTPLSKTKDPDLSMVVDASRAIASRLHKGQLVVLESTTYPGTTEELILPLLTEQGLVVGEDFYLAFSPERVDPGNARYNTRNTPKIVGGVTAACTRLTQALYSRAIDTILPVSSTRAAEMVKLLENTFRSVNIGMVNEVALMCARLGVDVWEVIDAASSKPFGFMPFYPGPGLGGHCIPIDPLYLSWKLKTLNYRARFIELAGEINSEMPEYVCERVAEVLNDRERSVKGSRILVLGVAYKRDIDDVRESPALDILKVLEQRGAKVSYSDPHVPELLWGDDRMRSRELMPAVREADLVLIVTDHRSFPYAEIVREAKVVLDTRNATKGITSEKIVKISALVNLPNALTFLRIVLVPVLVTVLLTRMKGGTLIGSLIFGLAVLTDWLDGWLARRRNQVTRLGILLDPIADKLLTSAAFLSLVELDAVPAWMVMIVIGREFLVTGFRNVALQRGMLIPASGLGKGKMVSQVVAIFLLLFAREIPVLTPLAKVALWIVVVMAVWSAADYLVRFGREVVQGPRPGSDAGGNTKGAGSTPAPR